MRRPKGRVRLTVIIVQTQGSCNFDLTSKPRVVQDLHSVYSADSWVVQDSTGPRVVNLTSKLGVVQDSQSDCNQVPRVMLYSEDPRAVHFDLMTNQGLRKTQIELTVGSCDIMQTQESSNLDLMSSLRVVQYLV